MVKYEEGRERAYPISMSEPRRPLLLVTHKRDPIIARMAKALPNIRVPIHPPHIPRLMKRHARRSTNPVRERFVVPEGRVLEYQPTTRFADTTPAFTFVSVTANPTRRVEITIKTEVLLMRLHIRVLGVHVFGRRWDLLLVKGSVEIGRIGVLGVR